MPGCKDEDLSQCIFNQFDTHYQKIVSLYMWISENNVLHSSKLHFILTVPSFALYISAIRILFLK